MAEYEYNLVGLNSERKDHFCGRNAVRRLLQTCEFCLVLVDSQATLAAEGSILFALSGFGKALMSSRLEHRSRRQRLGLHGGKCC